MTDWIEHDGRGWPDMPNGRYELRWLQPGIKPPDSITQHFPGWSWRVRLVWTGWLSWKRRKVCYDPSYAPITHYRRISDGVAMTMLRKIASNPEPIREDA